MKHAVHVLFFSTLLMPFFLKSAAHEETKESIPYTLERYKQCSEESIEKLSKESKAKVRNASSYMPHPIHMGGAKVVCRLARYLCERYPNDKMYALGQSPAYIIAAARLIQEMAKNPSSQLHHIAFSGKWWSSDDGGFTINPETPSKESIMHYRKHLEHIACTPEDIIKRMHEQEQRTIIVEYTLSAESLYSFLHILSDWSKELGLLKEVADSLEVCMLQGEKAGCFEKKMDKMHELPIHKHMLRGEADQRIYEFSMADGYSDRLVPYFPHKHWVDRAEHRDPKNYELPENAKYVLFELIKHLHTSKKEALHSPYGKLTDKLDEDVSDEVST